MGVVVETLLIGLGIAATFAHTIAFVRAWRYLPLAMKVPGIGRISILSWVSLKFWVVIFLALTLVLAPLLARGYLRREVVPALNLFLVVYLLVQPIAVNAAITRYQRKLRRDVKAAVEAEYARGLSGEGDRAEDDGGSVLG